MTHNPVMKPPARQTELPSQSLNGDHDLKILNYFSVKFVNQIVSRRFKFVDQIFYSPFPSSNQVMNMHEAMVKSRWRSELEAGSSCTNLKFTIGVRTSIALNLHSDSGPTAA